MRIQVTQLSGTRPILTTRNISGGRVTEALNLINTAFPEQGYVVETIDSALEERAILSGQMS